MTALASDPILYIRQTTRHRCAEEDIDYSVTPIAVYMYYEGYCGICGEEVEPDEASIDHIIPFTGGGKHMWGNVQLAHYFCNVKKGRTHLKPKYTPSTPFPKDLPKDSHEVLFTAVASKITYVLSVYPGISASMLQTGMGNMKPADWKNILEDLINMRIVQRKYVRRINPDCRSYSYCKLYNITKDEK